jgi:signal transduction histidine kinase
MTKHTNGAGTQAGGAGQRQTPGISLNTTLIISFVLLSVLPVAIALTIAIINSSTQAQQQVYNQLDSVAETKATSLEHNLQDHQSTLRGLLAASADQAELDSLLSASQPDQTLQNQIGQEMTAVLKAQNASFSEYFLYNGDGVILVSTNPAQVAKVVKRQPYFDKSLTGEYIQPPFYELGSGDLAVMLTRPIKDQTGQVVGVLAARLNMGDLATIMQQRTGFGSTGETYLVSTENNYLVTPSRFEGYPLTRAYHSQGIDSALAGKNGRGAYIGYRGQPVLGSYRWLPDLQVGLVAEIEQSEALATAQQAALVSLIVAVLAAVGAVAIGLWVAVRITRPIVELTRTTQKLAGGDLSVRSHITERNEIGALSQAFNAMAGRLEENLKALEASLKQAQVAETAAHEANRLKSEFLATMSHELRTPLNAMIGFTEIMISGMGGVLDQDAKHMSERIHANSQRLLALINDVLDLSKIEAKRVEVNEQQFSPRQMAADLRSQMASLAEKKGLAFEIDFTPNLPELVLGDRALIERVVTNLLSNAFKFTDQGNVQLSMAQTPDHSWTISVRDTGIGIPPHAQEFIFDPFRQLDGSSQRAYGGTGLGLAIVRDLVRAMDGAVKVDSVVGQGSAFTVTLPLVEAVQSEREVMLA